MEEEEEDDLELFGGYDSFRSYNSSAGSESSSYLEESSEAENEDREAGELPTSPLHCSALGTLAPWMEVVLSQRSVRCVVSWAQETLSSQRPRGSAVSRVLGATPPTPRKPVSWPDCRVFS
ncbi:lethal(3)malignant brain tumor-like protein 2 [Microtus pennsylvanicus]|uniref:lethal(3)malignant brain tumor-like protein 2 n=1 Tax=Microtus pennsylvanicus TaxID=10058 RepID=UPI003F6D4768